MVALILSDVIGDSLDTIASGPTVPSSTTREDITGLLDKYEVTPSTPASIKKALSGMEEKFSSSGVSFPMENGDYQHVQNVIVGSNSIATAAAADKARGLGYRSIVWSRAVQGEARLLGEAYAILAHTIARHQDRASLVTALSRLRQESTFVELFTKTPSMLGEFEQLFAALSESDTEVSCNLCLISGGEPTVTVKGGGKGGRNQELALAFALKYTQLERGSEDTASKPMQTSATPDCVVFSLGTDGQDGPTDAAGAIGHSSIITAAATQDLNPEDFLKRNDSYSFFSRVEGGKHHLKTGLTGTNVMDLHCILLTSAH